MATEKSNLHHNKLYNPLLCLYFMAQDIQSAKETKSKIISVIKIRGPVLPVQIAHQVEISSIFAGAFLSELAGEKAIKISNMKVGGSPLYYLQGQEHLLENFYKYLPEKEREAFLLLKEKKILADKEQLPAIRVALRSIKDFAKSFSKDNEIMWRFHSVTEEQVREMLEKPEIKKEKQEVEITKPAEFLKKPVVEAKPEIKLETKEKPLEIKKEARVRKPRKKLEVQKQANLDIGLTKPVKLKKAKEAKPKEKSDFVLKIISFLQKEHIELLEERALKKKEFSGVIRIDSPLGKIKLLCIAKDKKSVTETDLRLALQKSQAIKMPALILYQQEPNSRTQAYAEKWSSLLKLKKIEN